MGKWGMVYTCGHVDRYPQSWSWPCALNGKLESEVNRDIDGHANTFLEREGQC